MARRDSYQVFRVKLTRGAAYSVGRLITFPDGTKGTIKKISIVETDGEGAVFVTGLYEEVKR